MIFFSVPVYASTVYDSGAVVGNQTNPQTSGSGSYFAVGNFDSPYTVYTGLTFRYVQLKDINVGSCSNFKISTDSNSSDWISDVDENTIFDLGASVTYTTSLSIFCQENQTDWSVGYSDSGYYIARSGGFDSGREFGLFLFDSDPTPVDPKETPTSYITKPTIGQTYTAGSTVGFVVATDIELGTASSPIDYQFKLEQYVNSSWVAATVAAYNGDISTTGQWTYRDPNATEYVNYTPPGGTQGDYYGYGGGLRTVNISRLDGQYRISGRVAFTGNGYTYGPWSDTVLFGVGTSGYGPVINPDGSTAGSDSIGPPQWEGIGSLGSFIWDWVSYLLFPTADQFSDKVNELVNDLGAKWPFSWFTDTVGALIGSLLDSTTPECVANEPNLFLGPWPNACWFAASFRSLYGTWAEPAAAAGIWLWAAHEVWQTGKALLGLEPSDETDKEA